jgi:hypothetical protein
MFSRTVSVVALLVIATPALAGSPFDIHGLIVGNEGARYVKGVPTLDLQQQRGAIQLRSFGFYNNRPMFAIAFFNAGPDPVNIGLEDIHVTTNGTPLRVFTVQELERQAKQKAWWTQFGMALIGGIGAGVAASQRSTYHSTISGPYGSYHVHASYPSLTGQWQAAAIQADTITAIAAIQYQLDQTLDMVNNHVVQRTTVDPGESYAGLIVLDKLKTGNPPFEMHLDVDWNGERYPFAYVLQKPGKPVPDQYAAMLAANSKPKRASFSSANVAAASGAVRAPHAQLAKKDEKGLIFTRSGVVMVPSKTTSGYCLRVPDGYVSTGTEDYPIISRARPLCKDD